MILTLNLQLVYFNLLELTGANIRCFTSLVLLILHGPFVLSPRKS